MNKILHATNFQSSAGGCWGTNFTYEFSIDMNGNVFVKQGTAHYSDPQPLPTQDYFTIVDNIKMPKYIIDLLHHLTEKAGIGAGTGNVACRYEIVQLFFEIVQQIKASIKEMTSNPQNQGEIQEQMESMIRKNESMESQLLEMQQKIKNIQTAYFDILKDNETISQENNVLREKVKMLEDKIKTAASPAAAVTRRLTSLYSEKKVSRNNYSSSKTHTKSNAQNRMIYNETTGIYEPEEDK